LLAQVKQLLKQGMEGRDSSALEQVISFSKWAAAIYREGGTPPIDPRRGLTLSLQFAKENSLTVDTERPTYEPVWSVPGGDTSVLVRVQATEGEPYYAHLYIDREPSAWRYTGILTRIPYYDAPSVAQVRADLTRFAGKEMMLVGRFVPPQAPPARVGTSPTNPAFVLDTFSGPIWVTLLDAAYVEPLPENVTNQPGQLVRVFGTIRLENGSPVLEADSVQRVGTASWNHLHGIVESIDRAARSVTLQSDSGQPTTVRLTETTPVFLANAQRGTLADLAAGMTIDATGVPTEGEELLAEEIFISPSP